MPSPWEAPPAHIPPFGAACFGLVAGRVDVARAERAGRLRPRRRCAGDAAGVVREQVDRHGRDVGGRADAMHVVARRQERVVVARRRARAAGRARAGRRRAGRSPRPGFPGTARRVPRRGGRGRRLRPGRTTRRRATASGRRRGTAATGRSRRPCRSRARRPVLRPEASPARQQATNSGSTAAHDAAGEPVPPIASRTAPTNCGRCPSRCAARPLRAVRGRRSGGRRIRPATVPRRAQDASACSAAAWPSERRTTSRSPSREHVLLGELRDRALAESPRIPGAGAGEEERGRAGLAVAEQQLEHVEPIELGSSRSRTIRSGGAAPSTALRRASASR